MSLLISCKTTIRKQFKNHDLTFLFLSVFLQVLLAFLFGHLYDMRIFMATGYLVGTGQNPYIAQDLSIIFNNPSFHNITTIGYPPLWPLVLGFLFRISYAIFPSFLFYNLVIKIPIILANIILAYQVKATISKLVGDEVRSYRAWLFLLFNPFLFYFTSAWGQIDSIIAVLTLSALINLDTGKLGLSAILLALSISFKPTAIPVLPLVIFYLLGKSNRQTFDFLVVFTTSMLLFCVAPFILLNWDPTVILQNWNSQFSIAGGMSLLSIFELLFNSYQLPGYWWLLGLVWIPALGVGIYILRPRVNGLLELIKKATGLILIFFLTRTWLSEPNITLILPLVVILTSIGELNPRFLAAIWILPLIFTFFNNSLPQLFFPSMPEVLNKLIQLADNFRTARLIARSVMAVLWQIAGWFIVVIFIKRKNIVHQVE